MQPLKETKFFTKRNKKKFYKKCPFFTTTALQKVALFLPKVENYFLP